MFLFTAPAIAFESLLPGPPLEHFSDVSVQVLENVLHCHFTSRRQERCVVELLLKAGFQQCETVSVGWLQQQPSQAR